MNRIYNKSHTVLIIITSRYILFSNKSDDFFNYIIVFQTIINFRITMSDLSYSSYTLRKTLKTKNEECVWVYVDLFVSDKFSKRTLDLNAYIPSNYGQEISRSVIESLIIFSIETVVYVPHIEETIISLIEETIISYDKFLEERRILAILCQLYFWSVIVHVTLGIMKRLNLLL